MNSLQTFETICNETTKYPNGTSFTLTSICEENGEFEIVLFGNGGFRNCQGGNHKSQ